MPTFSILVDRRHRPSIRPTPDVRAIPGQLYFVRNRNGEQHLVMCRLKADGKTRQLGPLPHGFARERTIDHVPLGFWIYVGDATPTPCTAAEVAIDYLLRHRGRRRFVLDFRPGVAPVARRRESSPRREPADD